ncbi:type II secretory pathway pseudopilin PulG [Paenibacillus rhizosphaerae]|uniref:Type II secretory pathway pseudopilin PulG n=1 Tax=Paenibacillus rhizosphaerae TaxID=297318 RepID=A0A839TJI2_9BACL|nr:hypothetical protein [Paenibacillus rhizosphaerae]MBB3125910.1 type II secretory pathway pseudopilin PulG [Paenibacillus rhizosphaerae]
MEPWLIVVILGAAALVYAMMLPKRKEEQSQQGSVVKQVEATLEQYMAEIENENVELVELVAQMKQEMAAKQLSQQEQLTEMRHRLVSLEQQVAQQDARLSQVERLPAGLAPVSREAAAAVEPEALPGSAVADGADSEGQGGTEPALSEQQPSIRDRYPELFELYSAGKSIDAIGKMTGMHRGEIQLILQLAKQEETV